MQIKNNLINIKSRIERALIKSEDRLENAIYLLFLFLLILIGGAYLIVRYSGLEFFQTVPSCMFYQMSGLYCPGCGGTRSMEALLTGHVLDSLYYHAFATYLIAGCSLFMGWHTIYLISKKRIPKLAFRIRYIIIGAILLGLQYIIKIIVLLVYNYQWL